MIISKFSYASLPKLSHFFSFLFSSKSENKISKPWRKNNEKYFWFSCSAFSMYFIAKWRLGSFKKKIITIWIPDYFCESTLLPLKLLNVKIIFYPISSEFKFQKDWFESNEKLNKPDILFLVHYFGKSFSSDYLNKFCIKNECWLVDDATHLLEPTNNIGINSDFTIYSPHKHLPIADGAILLINQYGLNNLNSNNFKIEIDQLLINKYILHSNLNFKISWYLKRLSQKIGFIFRLNNKIFWPDNKLDHPSYSHIMMSDISKSFLVNEIKHLNDIHNTKIKNNKLILSILKSENIMNYDYWETPYMTIIKNENFEIANILFNKMLEYDLPVTTWPDLPTDLFISDQLHYNAINYRKTHFFLINNQSLNVKSLTKTLTKLKFEMNNNFN